MTVESSQVEESEQDFVRRASQGDSAAFTWLFRRYSRPLMSFLFGMTGHREQAEDLMQETISRVFLNLPKLRSDAKFSTWLFGIAKNVTREMLRGRAHNPGSKSLDDLEVDTLADPKANAEASAQRLELHRAIRAGISTLDQDLQTALGLRVFAEMKYDEIAEMTGWSSAKVKIEIHRARLKMRKAIAPYI